MASTKQLIAKFKRVRRELLRSQKPLLLATTSAHAEYVKRIFKEGKKAGGAKIGDYTDDTYKSRRQKRGRQIANVDLFFEGRMFQDISASVTKTGALEFSTGTTRAIETTKLNAHIERYGIDVFQLSKREKTIFKDVLNFELNKIFK